MITVAALSDRDALQSLLPPGCLIWGEPHLIVTVYILENLGWLAGRGYNIVSVAIPAEFHGRDGITRGDFVPVLWETHADPIITGRDELGFSKLYASVAVDGSPKTGFRAKASWEGFDFFDLETAAFVQGEPGYRHVEGGQGSLHYKYIPRVGAQHIADVEYMVLMPASPAHPDGGAQGKISVEQSGGSGSFRFRPARWEDMPTQYPVVNALADLQLHGFVGATCTRVVARGTERGLDGAMILR